MTDGSHPLADGQHEDFAQQLAFGKCSILEAYKRCGGKGARQNASKLASKGDIKSRVAWLKAATATAATLTVSRKREKLAGIVENELSEVRDIIKAIEVDNVMAGHNKPQEHHVTIDALSDEITSVRARK